MYPKSQGNTANVVTGKFYCILCWQSNHPCSASFPLPILPACQENPSCFKTARCKFSAQLHTFFGSVCILCTKYEKKPTSFIVDKHVLEIIWPFINLDAQIKFWIFFLPVSALSFLIFRLLWTLKAQVSGDESENNDSVPVLRLSLRNWAFLANCFSSYNIGKRPRALKSAKTKIVNSLLSLWD